MRRLWELEVTGLRSGICEYAFWRLQRWTLGFAGFRRGCSHGTLTSCGGQIAKESATAPQGREVGVVRVSRKPLEVSENSGHYVGMTTLKQRDFGINPVRIAGGTVKVKDTVKIEFEVVTAQ